MSDTAQTYPDTPRVDARDKVRGTTRYAADDARADMLHATLAIATIGRGRVDRVSTRAARTIPGVRLVLTHDDAEVAGLKAAGFVMGGGYAFQNFQPMLSPEIAYRGQPIALVVAETLEAATEAAVLVEATYTPAPIQVSLDAPAADIVAQADSPLPKPMFADVATGDADAAFADAPLKIDAAYTGPPQHQNPMELLATVAEWGDDGTLIIHEGTQNAEGVRQGLARQLGLTPDKVRVISPYVGGSFGQKNSLQMHTALTAVAARRLKGPVKLVVPRAQGFHDASFRPASRHRMRLGAERDGRMVAAIHEADSQTSRHDLFPTQYASLTARLYGIGNFRGRERLVRTDVQTPGYMRAPYEHIAAFALEGAVDELAYELDMDPVALRIANDTTTDPITKRPFSSRHLAECLRRGAERFGWSRRAMAPGSMRADDGSLVGWGVASGAYPGSTAPAIARLRITDTGGVFIDVGVHEMGQGVRTALAAAVAARLRVPVECVIAEIGDTRGTPQHLTAGAWGTATAVPAAVEAAEAMLDALRHLDPEGADGADGAARRSPAHILKAAGRASLEVEIRRKAQGQPDAIFGQLTQGLVAAAGPEYPEFVTYSYIAHFVEVRIEPGTHRVRIPRVVSVADCGRVVSPRTARSQVAGGVVWGIGASLREVSEVDARFGGFLNDDLADYVVPVNADIGSIEVDFIDEPDPLLNSVGVKTLGEVAMVGVAPAIANAIHHATGRRLRDLPIRIEQVL